MDDTEVTSLGSQIPDLSKTAFLKTLTRWKEDIPWLPPPDSDSDGDIRQPWGHTNHVTFECSKVVILYIGKLTHKYTFVDLPSPILEEDEKENKSLSDVASKLSSIISSSKTSYLDDTPEPDEITISISYENDGLRIVRSEVSDTESCFFSGSDYSGASSEVESSESDVSVSSGVAIPVPKKIWDVLVGVGSQKKTRLQDDIADELERIHGRVRNALKNVDDEDEDDLFKKMQRGRQYRLKSITQTFDILSNTAKLAQRNSLLSRIGHHLEKCEERLCLLKDVQYWIVSQHNLENLELTGKEMDELMQNVEDAHVNVIHAVDFFSTACNKVAYLGEKLLSHVAAIMKENILHYNIPFSYVVVPYIRGFSPYLPVTDAVHAIWALSFDEHNKKTIVDTDGLIDRILELNKHSVKPVKHACNGILWTLRDTLKDTEYCDIIKNLFPTDLKSPAHFERSSSIPDIYKQGHVMISYQWANQNILLDVRDRLKAEKIPVWMDVDDMGGSTLQAMAEAIENAHLVLICMSQKYKDSPNCRAEAEYAFQKRKLIVPLIMENRYRPDGWLGMILGSKLFYDFSGKYPFQTKIGSLLKEVEKSYIPSVSGDSSDGVLSETKQEEGKIEPETSSVSSAPPPAKKSEEKVKKWTEEEVRKWTQEHNIKSINLNEIAGEELVSIRNVQLKAPEFFYRILQEKLELSSVRDLFHFENALNHLFS